MTIVVWVIPLPDWSSFTVDKIGDRNRRDLPHHFSDLYISFLEILPHLVHCVVHDSGHSRLIQVISCDAQMRIRSRFFIMIWILSWISSQGVPCRANTPDSWQASFFVGLPGRQIPEKPLSLSDFQGIVFALVSGRNSSLTSFRHVTSLCIDTYVSTRYASRMASFDYLLQQVWSKYAYTQCQTSFIP